MVRDFRAGPRLLALGGGLLTVREVAAELHVSTAIVYRLVQRGELPGVRVSSAWRIERADLAEFVAEQKR